MWTVDVPSWEQIKIYITVFMGFDIVGYEPAHYTILQYGKIFGGIFILIYFLINCFYI